MGFFDFLGAAAQAAASTSNTRANIKHQNIWNQKNLEYQTNLDNRNFGWQREQFDYSKAQTELDRSFQKMAYADSMGLTRGTHLTALAQNARAAGLSPLAALGTTPGPVVSPVGGSGGFSGVSGSFRGNAPTVDGRFDGLGDAIASLGDVFRDDSGMAKEAAEQKKMTKLLQYLNLKQSSANVKLTEAQAAALAMRPAATNTRPVGVDNVPPSRASGRNSPDPLEKPSPAKLRFGDGMFVKTDPLVSGAEAYEERYGDVGGSIIGFGILGKDAAYTLDGLGVRVLNQAKSKWIGAAERRKRWRAEAAKKKADTKSRRRREAAESWKSYIRSLK